MIQTRRLSHLKIDIIRESVAIIIILNLCWSINVFAQQIN